MLKINNTISTILLFALTLGTANAVIIPSDLEISGEIAFDVSSDATDSDDRSSASQSATMTLVDAGVPTVTTVANVSPTGSNPLGDLDPSNFTFSDFGDGLGVDALVNGEASTAVDSYALAGDMFFDFAFALSNSSATDTYQVFFELVFTNNVDADGVDAFTEGEINLYDNAFNETFFSDLASDTALGDVENGNFLASDGAALSDSGVFNFDFTLGAGASDTFSGGLRIAGGAFDSPTSLFAADASAFVRILRAENLTNTQPPPPVNAPEPGSVLLLLSGLIALGIKRRVSK
jgi:hypothetical protein